MHHYLYFTTAPVNIKSAVVWFFSLNTELKVNVMVTTPNNCLNFTVWSTSLHKTHRKFTIFEISSQLRLILAKSSDAFGAKLNRQSNEAQSSSETRLKRNPIESPLLTFFIFFFFLFWFPLCQLPTLRKRTLYQNYYTEIFLTSYHIILHQKVPPQDWGTLSSL